MTSLLSKVCLLTLSSTLKPRDISFCLKSFTAMETKKRYKYCFVPSCKSTTIKTPQKKFILVPKKDGVWQKWFAVCQRDLSRKPSKSSIFFCCEDHFNIETDFANIIQHSLTGCRLILKEGVLPSKFDCQKDRHRSHAPKRKFSNYSVRKSRTKTVDALLQSQKDEEVCELHFQEADIERETSGYDDKTGRHITVRLAHVRFKKNAVPSLLLGYSAYMFTAGHKREGLDVEYPKVENKLLELAATKNLEDKEQNLKEWNLSNHQSLEVSSESISVDYKKVDERKANTPPNPNMKFQLQPDKIHTASNTNVSSAKDEQEFDAGCVVTDSSSVATNNTGTQNTLWRTNVLNNKQKKIIDLSFKGENLQQLSTNTLPPYIPGSVPSIVRNDSASFEMYCCTDCGDTFTQKSSLTFHLERRSVLIKFPCDTCKIGCIFYNRCTLQSHIRSHVDKGEASDIAKALVSPLPCVYMDGIQTEFVNNLDELKSIDVTELKISPELLEFPVEEVASENNTVPDKEEKKNEISALKVKCVDCNEDFESIKERKEHLTNGEEIPALIFQCNKCGMVCPSKCNLMAHQRIHLQISPYVCPECGDSPDPQWAKFQHHVNFKCFHNARSIGFKCPVCKHVSPSNESPLKHMELHTEKYAKCEACPRAYMSTAAFEAHNNTYHGGKNIKYNIIYKCSLCNIVFLTSDQMLTHRSTHLKEQICEYVFSCMQCEKILDSKAQLSEHIKVTHPKIFKHIIHKEPAPSKPTVSSQIVYRGKVECLLCRFIYHNKQSYNGHFSRSHVNVNHPCIYCLEVISNRKEMVKHGKQHLQNGYYLCLLCMNERYIDETTLGSHLVKHTERLKFCTFCPVCGKLLQTYIDALKHIQEEHFLIPKPKHKPTEGNVMENIFCHFCGISFANETELQNHLKKEHDINCQRGDSNSYVHEATEEQPLNKQRIEGNTCAKCQLHSLDRAEFKKHLLSHKTNKSTFQCQECGFCFVVEPSLTKHLKVVHKISDTQKYIAEEGTNFLPDIENPTEITTRNALECSVCLTTFPNETSLKTHMRSHGMAFIQAKKSTAS